MTTIKELSNLYELLNFYNLSYFSATSFGLPDFPDFRAKSQPHPPQKRLNIHLFLTLQLHIGNAYKAIGSGKFQVSFTIGFILAGLQVMRCYLVFAGKYPEYLFVEQCVCGWHGA